MTEREIPLLLNNSVGFQLNRAAQLFRRELRCVLGNDGIQAEQWQVLVALADARAPRTQQEIADLTLADKHTTSRMLSRMERDGWIKREPHPTDSRSQHVILTKKARARYPLLVNAVHSHFEAIFAQLPARDTRELLRLLLCLRRILKDIP